MRSLKYSNRHKGGNFQHFLQYEITFDGIEIHDSLKNKIHTKLMFCVSFASSCFGIVCLFVLFVLCCFFGGGMEGLSVRMAMTIDEGEEFEDTKGVIKIRISKKNRQHDDEENLLNIAVVLEENDYIASCSGWKVVYVRNWS